MNNTVSRALDFIARHKKAASGAALVLAALAAQGRSQIGGVAYLDRGYADFTEILASLGARIYRETKPA